MAAPSNPYEQYTPTELLLRQESNQLRRTNQSLERQVQAHTRSLNLINQQLENEIVERKKTEQKLQDRIAIDQVLNKISNKFINLAISEIDDNVNQALEEIGKFNGFDRAYIYLLEENGRSLQLSHGWQQEDHPTTFTDFSHLPATLFDSWLPRLLQQESLFFQKIAQDEQTQSNELKLLALQGVGSALILPLVFSNQTIGLFILDSQKPISPWQGNNIETIKMMGTIIINALVRQKTELTLTKERNFAKQIMRTMGQGLVSTNVEGTFEYVNPAYAAMLGYEPAALIGQNALDISVTEDHPQIIHAQMQNLEGKASSFEARLCHTDGSWIYVLINSVPNFDAQERVVGTIATVTDLTERRRAESQIEAHTREINLIYNSAVKLLQPGSLKNLAQQIANITIDELGFHACDVLLLDKPLFCNVDGEAFLSPEDDENFLVCLGRDGRFQQAHKDRICVTERGLVTTAVREGTTIYAPDVTQDERYVLTNTYTQSEMVIPLRAYDHVIGAIDLQSPHKNGFTERDRRIVTIFAENAGLALETARLNEQLREHAQQLELQINKRNKVEQALRTNEQQYRQLVENATDIIYRTDAHGYCTYANPVTVRKLGYSDEKELLGCHYTDFLRQDFKVEMIKIYNKQKAEHTPNTYHEFVILDKDQKEIWLGQNVQLIIENGEVVGFQALARDITIRRQAEEKLRIRSTELNVTNAKLAKALRAKDEFLANMSHELRTPLNAVLGKAEILLEGINGPLNEKQVASIQVIEESGNHLLDLINDILDVAKIEAGKISLDIQPVILANICESSMQFVRQMAHKKSIKLNADIDHSLKTCQADARRLKQILINLLSNAVKFTPVGGEVGLNVVYEPEREAIQFQVWDTGIGISAEDMQRLFQPFSQVDSSLARSHEGTGLGLSLVYHLADLHGGSISLESEVGVGSCFTVTLPQNPTVNSEQIRERAQADRAHYAFEQITKQHFFPGEEPLILLVEDSETNIEIISEYLPVWGYKLLVASTGREALARAREMQPDLILMDVQIPEIDGLTAVRELRQDKNFAHTPIVVLTALAMSGDRERCLAEGADEYLSKPVELRELVRIINQLLAKARSSVREPNG